MRPPAIFAALPSLLAVLVFLGAGLRVGAAETLREKLLGHIEAAPEESGLVTLVVDDTAIVDIEVLYIDNSYYLSRESLGLILQDYLEPGFHSEVFDSILKPYRWVGAEQLDLAGFDVREDTNSLTFSLRIPPSRKPVSEIRISSRKTDSIKPILLPSPFSASLNAEARAGIDFSVSGVSVPASCALDAAINVRDWVLEAAGRISYHRGFSYGIQQLRLVRDIGMLGARLYGGMVSTTAIGYQGISTLYGLTLDSFDFVPGRRAANTPVSRFIVEERSIVRILLNGTPLLTLDLEPGSYDVGQFDFTPGINDFLVEIEGRDGRVRRLRAVISREDMLLAKDATEFSASAGVGRSQADPHGSAFIRAGISPVLTAGGYLQLGNHSGLAGVSGVYASPAGAFSLDAATMIGWDGRSAQAARLRYRLSFPGRSALPSFGLGAEIRTPNFETPTASSAQISPEGIIGLSAQMNVNIRSAVFLGCSASWTRQYTGDLQDSSAASLSLSTTLNPGYALVLSAGITKKGIDSPVVIASLRLNVHPGGAARLFSFSQVMGGGNTVNISSNSPERGIEASLQAENILGAGPGRSSVALSARKTTAIGDAAAYLDHQYAYPETSGTATRASISASTGIGFVNGRFVVSRRIYDSFLIFAPPPSLASERIDVRGEGSLVRSSLRGAPVLLPLSSHQSILARLNLPESSPELVLRTTTATVSPRYRSGIFFTTSLVRSHSVSATLVDQTGNPLAYIMAEVYNGRDESIGSTFTDENGYFELYELEAGTYTVRWPPGTGITRFMIPEDSPGELTLGRIIPFAGPEEGAP